MGAWIETRILVPGTSKSIVAPYVGAWIETAEDTGHSILHKVAPYVGAWIETNVMYHYRELINGRSLRGSVD